MTIAKLLKARPELAVGKTGSGHARQLIDYVLIDYVVGSETGKRILKRGIRNFSVAKDIAGARAEMIALANMAPRSKNPLRHYVISWDKGERPTTEQIKASLDILSSELGANRLQTIWALHGDTENVHLHVVINRVDPTTEKARRLNGGFEIEALHRATAKIDHELKFSRGRQRARYEIGSDGKARRTAESGARRIGHGRKTQRQADEENRRGEKSAATIAAEKAGHQIAMARSWAELHARLAKIGMRYEKKGSGAIIWVGQTVIKASSAGREASRPALEIRLGAFKPRAPEVRIGDAPGEEPAHEIGIALGWREYSRARTTHYASRTEAKQRLDTKIKNERQGMRARHLAERKALQHNRPAKISFNAARSLLAHRHAAERAAAQVKDAKARRSWRQSYPPFPGFEGWLRDRSSPEAAEAWRTRHHWRGIGAAGEYVPPHAQAIGGFQGYVQGRVVHYRRAKGGRIAFIDEGRVIQVLSAEDDALVAALQLGQQKWGRKLSVIGSAGFKSRAVQLAVEHGIFISNPELQTAIEAERQRREAKIRSLRAQAPTAALTADRKIAETPLRMGAPDSPEYAAAVADVRAVKDNAMLARRFEVTERRIAFLKAQQTERATRGEKKDAPVPQEISMLIRGREVIRAVLADRGVPGWERLGANKAQEVVQKSKQVQARTTNQPQQEPPTAAPILRPPGESGAMAKKDVGQLALFEAHRLDIERSGGAMDNLDRLHYTIALRLRATGHDRNDVVGIISAGVAQAFKKASREEVQKYSNQLTAQAFGPHGDTDIQRFTKLRETWRAIEESAIPASSPGTVDNSARPVFRDRFNVFKDPVDTGPSRGGGFGR